jgi:hypothetical protein
MTVFDRLYWTIMLLGIVSGVVNWQTALTLLSTNPAIAVFGLNFVYGILIGSVVLGLAINVLLWYFISRRASNGARWIWVVLVAIGLPGLASNLLGKAGPITLSGAGRGIIAINVMLQIAAAVMLFRADSRAWFASGGQVDERDVFN